MITQVRCSVWCPHAIPSGMWDGPGCWLLVLCVQCVWCVCVTTGNNLDWLAEFRSSRDHVLTWSCCLENHVGSCHHHARTQLEAINFWSNIMCLEEYSYNFIFCGVWIGPICTVNGCCGGCCAPCCSCCTAKPCCARDCCSFTCCTIPTCWVACCVNGCLGCWCGLPPPKQETQVACFGYYCSCCPPEASSPAGVSPQVEMNEVPAVAAPVEQEIAR
jgi:hypothetical protein